MPAISRPTASNVLGHSASGPLLCLSSYTSSCCERPHTISSAYDHTLSRPQVTARTFEPPYGFVKAQATTSIYATPTNIYRQTADIYARPTLCGRRFSQGAVAVAPPVVPSGYATCQKQVISAGTSTGIGNRSATGDKSDELTEAHIHRSCSLPSPVYSDVCNFFCIAHKYGACFISTVVRQFLQIMSHSLHCNHLVNLHMHTGFSTAFFQVHPG